MFTGVFKLKDGMPLAIRDSNVVVTIGDHDYALADIIDAMQVIYLPLYFDTNTIERHTVLPESASKIQLASIEADGEGTFGLFITMAHDIDTDFTLTLTEEETDCSAFAGRGVVFTMDGMRDQNKIAAMVLIS